MSGYFSKKHGEGIVRRILNADVLPVRNEIADIFKEFGLATENSGVTDYYGNSNLLMPNPLRDKFDNGDVDLFAFHEGLESSDEELLSVFGDSIFDAIVNRPKTGEFSVQMSVLFKSQHTSNMHQVDVNFSKSKENFQRIFELSRVPYFVTGYVFRILSRLGYSCGTNGAFVNGTKVGKTGKILVDEDVFRFVNNVLGLRKQEILEIDSYEAMGTSVLKNLDVKIPNKTFQRRVKR